MAGLEDFAMKQRLYGELGRIKAKDPTRNGIELHDLRRAHEIAIALNLTQESLCSYLGMPNRDILKGALKHNRIEWKVDRGAVCIIRRLVFANVIASMELGEAREEIARLEGLLTRTDREMPSRQRMKADLTKIKRDRKLANLRHGNEVRMAGARGRRRIEEEAGRLQREVALLLEDLRRVREEKSRMAQQVSNETERRRAAELAAACAMRDATSERRERVQAEERLGFIASPFARPAPWRTGAVVTDPSTAFERAISSGTHPAFPTEFRLAFRRTYEGARYYFDCWAKKQTELRRRQDVIEAHRAEIDRLIEQREENPDGPVADRLSWKEREVKRLQEEVIKLAVPPTSGMRYSSDFDLQLALLSYVPGGWKATLRPLCGNIPSEVTLREARNGVLTSMGLGEIVRRKGSLELWDGEPDHVEILLRAQWHTNEPLATLAYDAKSVKASISVDRRQRKDTRVRGVMYDVSLTPEESDALFRDPHGMPELKTEFEGDVVKALHCFVLVSADAKQRGVVLMVLPSSNGTVAGVSGFREAEAQLKETVLRILPHLRQPLLSVCDGDTSNRYRPRAVAEGAVRAVEVSGLDAFGDERLHEFAERQDPQMRSSPDPLHVTKLEIDRGMPEESMLVMFPLLEASSRVPIRQVLLACGTPPTVINPARKMNDQNPTWVANSNICRMAVDLGHPELLPFVIPIILHLRTLMDVAPREQLLNWATVLAGFALMQLVVKQLPEAQRKGWSDPNTQSNQGLNVQSSETYEKVFAGAGELAAAIADPSEKYLGILSSQCVEHTFGLWADGAHGDLSMVNIERVIGMNVGKQAILHALCMDAAKPGRLSQRHSGSHLPAVDGINEEQVLTIRQGVEAAFEIIELSMPAALADGEIEWPDVFGRRGAWRAFGSLDELLRWLPQPQIRKARKILSTEQLGMKTATAWSHLLHIQGQHRVFAEVEPVHPKTRAADGGRSDQDEPQDNADPLGEGATEVKEDGDDQSEEYEEDEDEQDDEESAGEECDQYVDGEDEDEDSESES
jgi:hypothetical protein